MFSFRVSPVFYNVSDKSVLLSPAGSQFPEVSNVNDIKRTDIATPLSVDMRQFPAEQDQPTYYFFPEIICVLPSVAV